ncbi:MAG: hypothetical protein NTV52_07770 [Acidobacteria bacterium]|nr:hypothetical protein [Acidobacteriota bacterium]
MDADAADLAGFGEANVRPGATAVDGFIDAIAVGGVAADGLFAHAGVEDVGVGRVKDHVDAAGFIAAGEGLLPGFAAVVGFEDAAFRVGAGR